MASGLEKEQSRLLALGDTAPSEAVAAARNLPTKGFGWLQLKAKVLCDSGRAVGDRTAVDEAVEIFDALHKEHPQFAGTLAYNLANALDARAQVSGPPDIDWYLRTANDRRRARALHGLSASSRWNEDARGASMTLTNLGNSLDHAHRWVEAFDRYQEALEAYPNNGVASGGAARLLFRVANADILGHQPHLLDVAARLANHAQLNRETVIEFAGPQAADGFAKLPSREGELAQLPQGKRISKYMRFVAEKRLFLSPIMEGVAHSSRRWDDAHIHRISERLSDGAEVPPIFAIFNVMKAEYLSTRELLYRGLREDHSDPGLYFDTLDYAVYGLQPALLTLAQRSALDLLDKVAVAVNEHFDIGENPRKVNFHSFWRETPSRPHWKPKLAAAIKAGNPALIALSEISHDLADGSQDKMEAGLLNTEKRARHAGTHRFTVLHEIGADPSRECRCVEHYELSTFSEIALNTVRLARAALFHFIEAVEYNERAKDNERGEDAGPMGTMPVRPHHRIRGKR